MSYVLDVGQLLTLPDFLHSLPTEVGNGLLIPKGIPPGESIRTGKREDERNGSTGRVSSLRITINN